MNNLNAVLEKIDEQANKEVIERGDIMIREGLLDIDTIPFQLGFYREKDVREAVKEFHKLLCSGGFVYRSVTDIETAIISIFGKELCK